LKRRENAAIIPPAPARQAYCKCNGFALPQRRFFATISSSPERASEAEIRRDKIKKARIMTSTRSPAKIIPRAFPGIKPEEVQEIIANSRVSTYPARDGYL